ncbi:MAG: CBS domain-containing protein, partial [Pirellulales bacterium]
MLICPYCQAENIEGADECAECSQPLTDMGLRVPASSVEADLLRDRIERLWPKTPSTVSPSTTVGEVLQKMVQETIGCVMVVDQGQLVGIFSERDALMLMSR